MAADRVSDEKTAGAPQAEHRAPPEGRRPLPQGGLHQNWPAERPLLVKSPRFEIRTVRKEHLTAEVHGWFQSPEFRRSFPDLNVPDTLEAFANLHGAPPTKTRRTLVILSRDAPIGFLWVEIDNRGWASQTHNFVADPAWRGWGVVHEARGAVLHALFKLGVHRVYGMPRADNARAIQCYRDQGFVEEGTLRDIYVHPDGYLENGLLFAILRNEFDPKRALRLPERVIAKIKATPDDPRAKRRK